MTQAARQPNRLVHETSPYLQQHANNPVDWYPWGPEVLARAKSENKPIFLSIGYSACHWCHVMEHESFEDESVAELLREHFLSVKVDREERPDLDDIYMTAVQLLTGQGGWPLTVFLTPDLSPFYGGTYFPPDDRYGRPSFKRLLTHLALLWNEQRDKVDQNASMLTEEIRRFGKVEPSGDPLELSLLQQAFPHFSRAFDSRQGGFGNAPKFPHTIDLRVLLRIWQRSGQESALNMVKLTLDKMARGGIYDHLGGGFARYSTDERWLVPHFEKMLYDNALLSTIYIEAWQVTRDPFYRQVVAETLAYVEREMTSPEGPFYSTQDADSEGEEGKFYVWHKAEIEQLLGPDLAEPFCYVYDVTEHGNWEGKTILHRAKTSAQDAKLLQIEEPALEAKLAAARAMLLQVRGQRVWPARDEKVLTAWNGLMISAFAEAARAFAEPRYAQTAGKAARFVLQKMRSPAGLLYRTYSTGTAPKLNAYLEDYSYLLDALVSLYEADFEPSWLTEAMSIADTMLAQFWDTADGGFYFTGQAHETLLVRTKDTHDGATPSANAKAAHALLRLAQLTGKEPYRQRAEQCLQNQQAQLASRPMSQGQMLLALDFWLGPTQEIAVVGSPESADTTQVLAHIGARYRPRTVLAGLPIGNRAPTTLVPFLADKQLSEQVTTYVCENYACQAPLVGVAAVERELR